MPDYYTCYALSKLHFNRDVIKMVPDAQIGYKLYNYKPYPQVDRFDHRIISNPHGTTGVVTGTVLA